MVYSYCLVVDIQSYSPVAKCLVHCIKRSEHALAVHQSTAVHYALHIPLCMEIYLWCSLNLFEYNYNSCVSRTAGVFLSPKVGKNKLQTLRLMITCVFKL